MRTSNLIVMGLGFSVLAIPQLLLSTQASVALDAFSWVIAMVITGGILIALAPKMAHIHLLNAVLFWLGFGVGWAESIVIILWLAGAWSLGELLLRWLCTHEHSSNISVTQAVLLGATIWLAVWGLMIHFVINYRLLYLVLCLLPCILLAHRHTTIIMDLRMRAIATHTWMKSIPFWTWVAGLIVIGWIFRWSSFPSVTYDDHAQHLRIWTDLLTQHQVIFDVQTQIWSVAPFANDLLHGGLSLMAGGDARGAMNLGLGLLILVLMGRIMHHWKLSSQVQWLLIVLMASTPMLGNLLFSLQTELLLGVLALAGLRLLIDVRGDWREPPVLGLLACAALCAAIKLPGAVLGMTLLAALMLRCWSVRAVPVQQEHLLRWPAIWVLIPLGFVALHSYALAWKLTGNPLFPLYNAIFLSPFAPPSNFSDTRWIHGFSFSSYTRAFFETSQFFESRNYAAGWQYLLLLPISLLALWRPGLPVGFRLALFPLLGFGLVMFSATQYWRYLFPVMPIAGLMLAALFLANNQLWRTLFAGLVLLCIGLNIVFFTGISWMMGTPATVAGTLEGKAQITQMYAPAVLLSAEVSRLAPGARVLFPADTPAGATLHGTPLYVNWYAPLREKRFEAMRNAETVASFLAEENVEFAILNRNSIELPGSPAVLLREHLAQYGAVMAQSGPFVLYRMTDALNLYRKAFDLQSAVRKESLLPALLLPASNSGVEATQQPQIFAVIPTLRSALARYRVNFRCPSDSGFFIAQINWDVGEPYYRLVSCRSKSISFVEAFPVPLGARQGHLYLTVRDTTSVLVEDLQIEFN